MNQFALRRYTVRTDEDEPFFGACDVVVPVIDGVPLHETLTDRYFGIATEDVVAGQWLDRPRYVEDEGVVILDGDCGVAGCCGVMARITVGSETVTWDQFFARGRPPLPQNLKFVFDLRQYRSALARASELQPVEVTLEDKTTGE